MKGELYIYLTQIRDTHIVFEKLFLSLSLSSNRSVCSREVSSGDISAESYNALKPSLTVRITAFAKEIFRLMNNIFLLMPLIGPRQDPITDVR